MVEDVTTNARIPSGHKVATAECCTRRSGQKIRSDHRIRHPTDRTRRPCAHPQCRVPQHQRGLRVCDGSQACETRHFGRYVHGIPPRQRSGRHAQLHRGFDHRELFRDCGPHDRQSLHAGQAGRVSERRRRGGLCPWNGLRNGRFRRRLRSSSTGHVGVCETSQPRCCSDGRSGLRDEPDRLAVGRVWAEAEPHLPDDEHPERRRIAPDRGNGHRQDQPDATHCQ